MPRKQTDLDMLREESIRVALSIMRDEDTKPADRLRAADYAISQSATPQDSEKQVRIRFQGGADELAK